MARLALRTAALAALLGGGVAIALVARGGDGESPRTGIGAPPPGSTSPQPRPPRRVSGCSGQGSPRPLPASFPKAFPLPAGTVATKIVRYRLKGSPSSVSVIGHSPLGFEPALRFFLRELPKRGFVLIGAEAEPPREAESRFEGNGYRGGWKINAIPRCARAVAILVAYLDPA